ncbi:hypothetical protein MJL22_27710, partial [Salmonella enterica subsp. enterica serovar Montevideo]|nr:hypothetical protein [Salmonella enterica subsp. enterica serovar Montevideo]
ISIHSEWIEYHVKKCDVVLPLVAIATPIEYTRNPLRVFELDLARALTRFAARTTFRVRAIWARCRILIRATSTLSSRKIARSSL